MHPSDAITIDQHPKSPSVEFQRHLDRVRNRVAELRLHKEGEDENAMHIPMATPNISNKKISNMEHNVQHLEMLEAELGDRSLLSPLNDGQGSPYFPKSPKVLKEYYIPVGNVSVVTEETSPMSTMGTNTTADSSSEAENNNNSVQPQPQLQRCPVCTGPLLKNYNPDNDEDDAEVPCSPKKLSRGTTPLAACSIAMPFQDLLNELMGTKKMKEEYEREQAITTTKMEKPNTFKNRNALYCVICQAYIVKDEDELKKKEREIEQLERAKEEEIHRLQRQRSDKIRQVETQLKSQMAELDTQYKDQIEKMEKHCMNLEENHTRRIIELECDQQQLAFIKEQQERQIEKLLAKVYNGEELRRNLHNHLQELRGNIRVFCRVRPVILQDGVSYQETSPIRVSHDNVSLSMFDQRSNKTHDFTFDRVFPPTASQHDVFVEVSDFVQSALDGYNVCLFSYGQTGAGKTYTMQGRGVGENQGIIPRAVAKVLAQAKSLESANWEFTMSASFLEIYNEELRDLLWDETEDEDYDSPNKRQQPPKLNIMHDKNGKCFIENLTTYDIDTKDSVAGMRQLNSLMIQAIHSRSVATTNMSADSSRSHAVFILEICGVNKDTGTIVNGKLNLCDLAGSERLDRSGTGSNAERLRETKSINKSLSSLGAVFNALANKAKHVPYRNSKLTYLLQECLSGDGKALMFVNLSPTIASSSESLCSLRFARQVRQVSFGKITRNVQYAE